MIKISKLCKEIGVTRQTLVNWYKQGKVSLLLTPSQRYLITEEEYNRVLDGIKNNIFNYEEQFTNPVSDLDK